MSKTDHETRVAVEHALERLGATRALASGVGSKILVIHLQEFLDLLNTCTSSQPAPATATKTTTTPAGPARLFNPLGDTPPEISMVVADGEWVRVKFTRYDRKPSGTKTELRGIVLRDGKRHPFYDSFSHDYAEAMTILNNLIAILNISETKEFIGKEVYAQFTIKDGATVKRVSRYMTVEAYAKEANELGSDIAPHQLALPPPSN